MNLSYVNRPADHRLGVLGLADGVYRRLTDLTTKKGRSKNNTFSYPKTKLYNIITTTDDVFFKFGAFLLLDEQTEAAKLLETLRPEEVKNFKEFPIFQKFYIEPLE